MFFLSFYFYLILFFLFCFILYLSYLLKLRLRRSGIDLAAAVRHFLEITNIQALLTLLVLPEITTGPDVVAVRADRYGPNEYGRIDFFKPNGSVVSLPERASCVQDLKNILDTFNSEADDGIIRPFA